jgi:hypothetical protein
VVSLKNDVDFDQIITMGSFVAVSSSVSIKRPGF